MDDLGSNNNPRLSEIFHLGNFTDITKPIGWDDEGFRKIFPTKDLPFQAVEEVKFGDGSKPENKLIWGDNLSVMRSLPDESIDLIYIDPPFFSGRNYNLIFGDQDEERTFRDIWDGGLPTYIAWLNARIFEMHRLLKNAGSLFVHLDYHSVHYIKPEIDKKFGYENLRNEIIWYYKNGGGRSKKWLNRKHDTILYYTKSDEYVFNWKEAGEERNQDEGTFSGYFKTDKDGRRYQEVRANGKVYKYYCDEKKNSDDVWEMGIISQRDKSERIGYPTQKPEALLQKIVTLSTNQNDVVADFFLGGGTTAAVAQKLGRRWIGCDISRVALQVASDRIAKLDPKAGIEIPDEKAAKKYHHQIIYHGSVK